MATRALISNGGLITKLADEALDRFRIVTEGSDADHVKYPDADTDVPTGLTVDGADAAEDAVSIALLGRGETKVVKLNGTISKGEPLCVEAVATGLIGEARKVPTAAGAYHLIGFALEDGVDGQEIAIADCRPTLVGGWDADSRQFSIPAFAGDPTSPLESGIWYDSTNDRYRVKNGSSTATIQVVEE